MMRLRKSVLLAFSLAVLGCGDSDSPETSQNQPAGENSQKTGDEPQAEPSGQPQSEFRTVELPDDLPEEIPVYPGARAIRFARVPGGPRQTPSIVIGLETTDSVKEVDDFYKSAFPEQQWSWPEGLDGAFLHSETQAVYHGKKDGKDLQVSFGQQTRTPGLVAINIMYFSPDLEDDSTKP